MRRLLLARVALAVATGTLTAAALATPAAAADEPAVTGTVTDASGAPVESVQVVVTSTAPEATEFYANTDANGVYTAAVEPGTYRVVLYWHYLMQWAPQKLTSDEAATVTVGAGETVRVDEQLLPTGSLGGRITRADGTPLVGTSVGVHADYGSRYAYTDDNGSYVFEGLLAADYQVQIDTWNTMQWVPGTTDRAQAGTFTVLAGRHTTVDEALLPPATLRGRLVDTDGRPLESYAVLVRPADPDDWRRHYGLTDQNGEWSISDVLAGSYRVSFTDPAETRAQSPDTVISAGAGETVTVDYAWLPETTLVVKAVDSVTGSPVGGFCVLMPDQRSEPVCSDTDGAATIAGLPATSLTFEVEPSSTGYYLGRRGLPATLSPNKTTTVTVPLALGGKVAVTATDRATGRAVPETCFFLKSIGRPDTLGAGCTDVRGRATTEQAVLPGTYEAFVQAPGDYGHQWVGKTGGTGDQQAAARIVVRPGKTTKAPAVRLDPAGAITGVVTGVDGAPLDRANVRFRANDKFASGASDGVFTDETGRYTIGKLGPYAWPLLFMTDGYPYQWSGNVGNRFKAVKIPVPAGGNATYDTALTRTSTLRGTITPPTGSVRLFAHNAATGDLVGVYSQWSDVTAYELQLAGDQQVKLQWNIHGDSTAQTWHANAADITTATKVTIPASGVKRLNLTYP